MKGNLFLKSCWILLTTVVLGLQACSDDDEVNGGGSIALNKVTLSEQTYSVAEDGTFSISFTVEPTNAEVATASITPESLSNGNPFEVVSLSKGQNGNWTVSGKTTDLALLKAEQTLQLFLRQNEVGSAAASFTLKDPYTIDGQFEAHSPHTVSFCDVDTKKAMALPIVITSQTGGDLSKIKDYRVIVSDVSLTDLVKTSDFTFMTMKNNLGIAIQIKQETVDQIYAKATYIPAQFDVYALTEQGRAARFHVSALFATPYIYVDNEEMTFKRSDLLNKDFEQDIHMDLTDQLNRLGFTDGSTQPSGDRANFIEAGIFTPKGDLVDEAPQFIVMMTQESDDKHLADVYISGDEQIPASGDYHHGTKIQWDWSFGDYTYPRLRGELRLNLKITD